MPKPTSAFLGSLLLFGGVVAIFSTGADAGADSTTRPGPAPSTTSSPGSTQATTGPAADAKAGESDEPRWDEFSGLVGLPKDSPKVEAFVAKYRLTASAPGDSGVLKSKDLPVTLVYTGNKIARVVVHLYNSNPPIPTRYPNGTISTPSPAPIYHGDLVNGIRPFDHSGDVVRRLGPPTHEVELEMVYYKELGLTFKFDSEKHRLYEVDVDARSEE